jgi:hypothetical protein
MPGYRRPIVIRVQWLKAKSINAMPRVNYEKTLIGLPYEWPTLEWPTLGLWPGMHATPKRRYAAMQADRAAFVHDRIERKLAAIRD